MGLSRSNMVSHFISPGFPASEKIREIVFSSGKSRNFVQGQVKSGNFALTEVNQVSTLI